MRKIKTAIGLLELDKLEEVSDHTVRLYSKYSPHPKHYVYLDKTQPVEKAYEDFVNKLLDSSQMSSDNFFEEVLGIEPVFLARTSYQLKSFLVFRYNYGVSVLDDEPEELIQDGQVFQFGRYWGVKKTEYNEHPNLAPIFIKHLIKHVDSMFIKMIDNGCRYDDYYYELSNSTYTLTNITNWIGYKETDLIKACRTIVLYLKKKLNNTLEDTRILIYSENGKVSNEIKKSLEILKQNFTHREKRIRDMCKFIYDMLEPEFE